jgi:RNA polymerase sigma-70 factor, ECF subfamily
MNTLDIWYQFNQHLLKFIHKRVKNEFDAEDILQDVFRKIHDSIQHLSDESKIQSWVYRITRNAITDYYRVNAKRNGNETFIHYELDIPEEPGQIENLNQVVSGWLRCMIEDLDEKYREAILLTEFENVTQKELANRLGISVSGAKSRVQSGREKIKEMLLACCHIERDGLGNVIDFQRKSASCNCNLC